MMISLWRSWLGRYFFAPILFNGILLGSCTASDLLQRPNESVPATLIGVHHLGPDYLIYRFYINKVIGDNVGEGGGGGSMVCCVVLPRKWQPSLTVDVRWAVDHILRSSKPGVPEKAEVEGIYHAQVPVEPYIEPGDFYVHFFPNGRVRVVVSKIGSDREAHPIRSEDAQAIQKSIKGKSVKALFTVEEAAERRRAADDFIKEHGDWR